MQPLQHKQTVAESEDSEGDADQSSQSQSPAVLDQQQRLQQQQEVQPREPHGAAEADCDSAAGQQHQPPYLGVQSKRSDVCKLNAANRAEQASSTSLPTSPRLCPPHDEISDHASINFQPHSRPDEAVVTAGPPPTGLSSSPLPVSSSVCSPPSSSSSSVPSSQPSLRPPPPIVLAHADWRAHLDSTPVPAWLQHYRIEGAAYNALSHLSFRQMYSLTEDDCRRMLGRRKGELLFACTRDYARKVQATYATRYRAAQQQQQLPGGGHSMAQSSRTPPALAADTNGSSDSCGAATVRERGRRGGRGRKRSAIHTAIIVSPPDVPSAHFVFIPPTAATTSLVQTATTALPLTVTLPASPHPTSPTTHSSPLAAQQQHSQHTTQHGAFDVASAVTSSALVTTAASTGADTAAPTALPSPAALTSAASVGASVCPSSPPVASSVTRSSSLSPLPPQLPHSSSLSALTDQLLDRSNAWLTRSVLSMFKEQQSQSHHSQQQAHTVSSGPAAANGAGLHSLVSGTRSSFSSSKAKAHLSNILSGAGALHELDPQPF